MSADMTFVKVARAREKDGLGERWAEESVAPTFNLFDCGEPRCVTLVVRAGTWRRNVMAQARDNGKAK